MDSGDQEAGAGSGFRGFIVSLFSSPHKEKESEPIGVLYHESRARNPLNS